MTDAANDGDGLDGRLRHLAETDDEGDWARLLTEEGGFLRAVARDHLGGEDLVDDVVQEAVVRLRRALARYRSYGDAEARGWLRGIVRHAAQDLVAAERSRRRRERTASEETERIHRQREAAAADPDYAERLESSLRDLPERLRRVIELHYYRGLSFGEIARRLELTPHHAHVLHGRALERLHRRLAPAGGEALSAVALIALLESRGAAAEIGAIAAAAGGGPATTSAARSTGRLVRAGRRSRWWWMAGAGGGAVAAAIVALVALGSRPSRPGDVIRRIPLPETVSHAGGCAAAPEALWVGRWLHRVDPATGEALPGDPLEVPYAEDDARGRSNRRAYYSGLQQGAL